MSHHCPSPMLTAEAAAAEVGLSLPAFWRAVASRRLPSPLYPAPRAPRWRAGELREALDATRALPAEAKAERLAARLASAAPGRSGLAPRQRSKRSGAGGDER